MHTYSSTDTATALRREWAAIHAPSTPTLEGAATFLQHFDQASIISTVRAVARTETRTVHPDFVGEHIRLRVQLALLRESDTATKD